MNGKRTRAIAFLVFVAVAVAGSVYYWLNGSLHLRPERRAMWAGAVQWWQGMTGHLLTQHREGLQLAELDPDSGRLLSVHDLYVDASGLEPALAGLAPGRWLILTGQETGSTGLVTEVEQVLRAHGWQGKFGAINAGAGVLVLSHCAGGPGLCEVTADLKGGSTAAVALPAGTRGPDGHAISRDFAIRVEPYD